MKRTWLHYLEDIERECYNIQRFNENLTYESFCDNVEKVYATAKAFENIGEAVKALPSELLEKYPEIPWSEVAKMRDVLTHHYFGLDDKILWNAVQKDVPILARTVARMLEDFNNQQKG